jgi:hypothetical protein
LPRQRRRRPRAKLDPVIVDVIAGFARASKMTHVLQGARLLAGRR